ncbi:MAG: 2OG-Fe(II) oxygenase [Myxococcales bacterium]|nr:2OG-Fe(II) oxygenase [Myxococcales bacterium]
MFASTLPPVGCPPPVLPLSDLELRRLADEGWFTREGFLGEGLALEARAACVALAEADRLRAAGIRRGADHTVDRDLRGDEAAWLADHLGDPALRAVADQFEALRAVVNAGAWLGLTEVNLQVARYPGGGARYRRHLDAFPGAFNRVLTAIVYLNPGWQPDDGGRLALWTPGRPTIDPVLDRLVVFLSERVPHAVEPAWAERWAITGWFRKPDPSAPLL